MKKRLIVGVVVLLLVIGAITEPIKAKAATSVNVGKVSLKSVKINGDNKPVIKWKAVDGATGYRVYRMTEEWDSNEYKYVPKWTKVTTTKKTTITDSKIVAPAGEEVAYKVRAYKKDTGSGKKVWGKYSKIKTITLPIKSIILGDPDYGRVEVTNDMISSGKMFSKRNSSWDNDTLTYTFFSDETVRSAGVEYMGRKEIAVAWPGDPVFEDWLEQFYANHKEYEGWDYVDIAMRADEDTRYAYTDDEGHRIYLMRGWSEVSDEETYGRYFLGYYGEDVYRDIDVYSNGYSVNYDVGTSGHKPWSEILGWVPSFEELDLGIDGVYAYVTDYELYIETDTSIHYSDSEEIFKIECKIAFNNDGGSATAEEYKKLLKEIHDDVIPQIIRYCK